MDRVTVTDRVYFREGQAVRWRQQIGCEPWKEVDCSLYGDVPPFVLINEAPGMSFVERKTVISDSLVKP